MDNQLERLPGETEFQYNLRQGANSSLYDDNDQPKPWPQAPAILLANISANNAPTHMANPIFEYNLRQGATFSLFDENGQPKPWPKGEVTHSGRPREALEGNEEGCGVCVEGFEEDKDVFWCRTCGKNVHRRCYFAWIAAREGVEGSRSIKGCPNCRAPNAWIVEDEGVIWALGKTPFADVGRP